MPTGLPSRKPFGQRRRRQEGQAGHLKRPPPLRVTLVARLCQLTCSRWRCANRQAPGRARATRQQTLTPLRRRRPSVRVRQAVEAGIFGPSLASAVEGELLMTAARDGTLSLWTMGGIHIGTFTQGTWKVGEGVSYGARRSAGSTTRHAVGSTRNAARQSTAAGQCSRAAPLPPS